MARRRGRQRTVEEQARIELWEEIERLVDGLALSEGPAEDAESISDAEMLKRWGQRDPRLSDPDGFQQQLMQTGLAQMPELMDPENPQGLAIFKAHPDLAAMYAEPVDDALADMLTRLAEFPLRLGLLAQYTDDPVEMVNYAERMDRRWQAAMLRTAGSTPDETVPAPDANRMEQPPTLPQPPVPEMAPAAVQTPQPPPAAPAAPVMPSMIGG